MSNTMEATETKVKLTEKLIADLKATGSVYPRWDTLTPNFGVIVSAFGVKSYFVQRRVPGRKHPKRVVLGRCIDMSLAKARERAEETLYKLRLGHDPRAKDLNSIILRDALERYLAKDKPRPLADSSKVVIRYIIERWLSDWLDLPLLSITDEMVDTRHSDIKSKISEDAKQVMAGRVPIDGKSTANRVMENLRTIWNFTFKKKPNGVVNPVVGLVLYDENSVSRSIPRAKHAEFYRRVISYIEDNPILGGAILVALFTGLRKENVQELLWSEIGERFIEIPAYTVKFGYRFNKGEPIKIPISDYLRWVFDEIERICGRHSSGYVFPTQSFGRKSPHITTLSRKISQIGNEVGIILSAHNLRHTYLGVCLEAKISWIATKRLAGHSLGKDGDITAAYQEADYEDDELISEADKVCRYMARRCGLDVPEPLTEAERMREAENQRLREELAKIQAKETENQRQIQRLAEELSAVRSLLASNQQSAR